MWNNIQIRKTAREINQILELVGLVKWSKYDKLARELQDLLLDDWDSATKSAIVDMIRAVRAKEGKFDRETLENMIADLSLKLGPKFANQVAQPLFEHHFKAYESAQKEVIGSSTISFNVVDRRAIAALDEHNIYWVKTLFDRQIQDTARIIGQQAIRNGLDYNQAAALFDEQLSEKTQTYGNAYWRGFAQNVITRSRSLGQTEAYVKAQIERFEIRAVLDHRTTPICREMHGRVIEVQKAVQMRNALIEAKSPDEVLEIVPWVKAEQVEGVDSAHLPAGLSMPPFHFRCRTRTVALTGTSQKVWEKANKLIDGGNLRQNELAAQIVSQTMGEKLLEMTAMKSIDIGKKSNKWAKLEPGEAGSCNAFPDDLKPVTILLRDRGFVAPEPIEDWDPEQHNIVDSKNPTYVLIHELGHAMAFHLGVDRYKQMTKKASGCAPVSKYAMTNDDEKIAEAFAGYMLGNRFLKREFEDNFELIEWLEKELELKLRPFGFKGE